MKWFYLISVTLWFSLLTGCRPYSEPQLETRSKVKVHRLAPDNMFQRKRDGKPLYSPIVVVENGDFAHIYLAGRTATDVEGEMVGTGDMRAQVRQVCENIKTGLENVGATFDDVVRTVTYTSDIESHNQNWDVRFQYFQDSPPTSTLIEVNRFGDPRALLEIEVEAVIEADRLRLP